MLLLTAHTEVAATAEEIFAIYTDVGNWRTWDSTVRSAELLGNVEKGARGVIRRISGGRSRIRVAALNKPLLFAYEEQRLFHTICHTCILQPDRRTTWINHQVRVRGLLSFPVALIRRQRTKKMLPVVLRGLKLRAEALAGKRRVERHQETATAA